MKKPVNILLFVGGLLILLILSRLPYVTEPDEDLKELRVEYTTEHVPSVDHRKFAVLKKDFSAPQEVTEACISCHTERHTEVLKSAHWNWERESYIPGRGILKAGKKNLLNNFCIGIGGSEVSCTRCHVGYGWEDKNFNFDNAKNIDCLVCHDNTGDYVKAIATAGYPVPDVDLNAVAQNVSLPKRANCGSCHFYGGGGNNVKHGDLEKTLFSPTKDVDVHMAIDGPNMDCVVCHEAENHKLQGKMYSVSSMNHDRVTCEQCHGEFPHTKSILNEHTVKVACQTCHIPIYAKVNATKMSWDWSTAGKLRDGEPYTVEDEDGNHIYRSIKGSFTWAKNVKPEYSWFNGTADHYFIGDKVDTSEVIKMNTLNGEYRDRNSKIIPVKVHRAKQIYDCCFQLIIQPKLYASQEGEGGFWRDFDWHEAAQKGMESAGAPYSGNFCFVNTEMSWPLNHMVSSKEKSVSCKECHTRDDSRLADLDDFYMPGRDYNSAIDFTGVALIILTLIGVILHGLIRLVSNLNKRTKN